MNTGFQNLNPAVSFWYLLLAAILSMVLSDPILMMMGLVFALLWCVTQKCELGGNVLMAAVTGLLVILLNPLFNHRGRTVLFYLFGNPITLEAFLYGFTAALSIMTILVIFIVYNRVITPDKFMMLFSKRLPKTSLLLMMCLRFIPELSRQYRELSGVQTLKHPREGKEGWIPRVKEAFRLLTLLFSNAVCGAIETAQSMRARGYGVYPKRTSWREQRLTARDICSAAYILATFLLTTGIWYGWGLKRDIYLEGYRMIENPYIYFAAALFYLFPLLTEGADYLRWNFSNWNN